LSEISEAFIVVPPGGAVDDEGGGDDEAGGDACGDDDDGGEADWLCAFANGTSAKLATPKPIARDLLIVCMSNSLKD
jgi:hypothetical protein